MILAPPPSLLFPAGQRWLQSMIAMMGHLGAKNGSLTHTNSNHLAMCSSGGGSCWVKPKSCETDLESPVWVVPCPTTAGDIVIQIGSDHCYYINASFTQYTTVPSGYIPVGYDVYGGSCAACEAAAPDACPQAYFISTGATPCGCKGPLLWDSLIAPILLYLSGADPGCTGGSCGYTGPFYARFNFAGSPCTGSHTRSVQNADLCVNSAGSVLSAPGLVTATATFPAAGDENSFVLTPVAGGCPTDIASITSAIAATAVW